VSIIQGEASHIEFSSITITGLVGSETVTNSQLPLGGAGAEIFGRNGSWDQISGTLVLQVACGQHMSDRSPIVIALVLANPWRGQQSPWLFTHVSGVCASTGWHSLELFLLQDWRERDSQEILSLVNSSFIVPSTYIHVDMTTPLDEVGSVAGDRAPLFVRSPSFVVRKIGQSSPVASAGALLASVNLITVTIVANVDLPQYTTITVRGLAPTLTPSSPCTVLAGGYSVGPQPQGLSTGSYSFYGDTFSSNDRGKTWAVEGNFSVASPNASWSPREAFAFVMANASVYLAGGWAGPAGGYLNDVWVFRDVGNAINKVSV
jgi:hypothetical protein